MKYFVHFTFIRNENAGDGSCVIEYGNIFSFADIKNIQKIINHSESNDSTVVTNYIQLKNNDKYSASKAIEIEDAVKTFIHRVDKGEIRSRKTYKQFKQILGID